MMGHFGPMGGMGQPGLMAGQFGAMGGMNPMMGPMMGSMPQNGMIGGMPFPTTMGNMGPTGTMGMGPSGMAGQATTILAWVASKAVSTWVQLHLRPPSPSPCMGLILKATGILFKATVNPAPDLGLLNLAIPLRRTPLPRSSLLGNPSLHLNIQSTLNILSFLNNLFTSSNLSTNLDLSRTTTHNLATTRLHKPLSTSIL